MFSSLVWEICSSGLYRWRSADRLDHLLGLMTKSSWIGSSPGMQADSVVPSIMLRDVADMLRLLIIDDSRMVQAKRLRSFSHRPSQKA
jgi:hypothetical protein